MEMEDKYFQRRVQIGFWHRCDVSLYELDPGLMSFLLSD